MVKKRTRSTSGSAAQQLDFLFEDESKQSYTCSEDIKELILRRRRQMLIHSYVYYHMNQTVISDDLWQSWADELEELQKKHGTNFGFYDDVFKDWDGSTGMHLPKDATVASSAHRMFRINENYLAKESIKKI